MLFNYVKFFKKSNYQNLQVNIFRLTELEINILMTEYKDTECFKCYSNILNHILSIYLSIQHWRKSS